MLVYYFCLIHVFYCLLFSFSLVYSAEPCIVSANSTDTTACEENADDQFGNLGYALVKVIRVFSIHNNLHLGLGIVNGERSFFSGDRRDFRLTITDLMIIIMYNNDLTRKFPVCGTPYTLYFHPPLVDHFQQSYIIKYQLSLTINQLKALVNECGTNDSAEGPR